VLIGVTGGELGGGRGTEAFTAWRRFCEALAEQNPTVLVIEDLHWADELLLDFLDHLVDWADQVPLLVVATARPELLSRRPGWGGGKPNSAIVSLAPLTEADTARLVGGLLSQVLLPAEVQAALLARSGGNPLYAEEYVRMLADRGFLKKAGGSWRLDRGKELPLPESVHGIIAARLDALAPEEKALLQDAAVFGKVGWVGALAALGNTQPFQVEQRLHTLERREFLRRERRSQVAGERQYAFRHVLVRDVAYAQLPRALRADKHRRVAEWLQRLSPDRAEDRAELLAHHFSAALELWSTADEDRPRLLLQLGRARMYGEQAGGDLLAEARDGLLAQGDREGAAEAETLLSYLTAWQAQGEQATQHAQRAVALLEDAGPSYAKAFALGGLAQDLAFRGELVEAIQVGRRTLTMAERLGLNRQRVSALEAIGLARVCSGDPGGSAELERAVAIAVENNLPLGATAYGNLANYSISQGQLSRGFELQAAGREVAERFGLASELRWFRVEKAFEDYWQGRWDAALDGANRYLQEAETGSPHHMEPGCRLVRGVLRLARGDLPGALTDAARAVQLARQLGELDALLPALSFHARTLLATGRVREASASVDELLAGVAARGVPATVAYWSEQLAIVLQALGRGAELIESAASVAMPTPWLQAATAMAAGEFEQAADRFAEIGSLPDEAYARLRGAEQLLNAGHRADGHGQLEQALGFYRQVRATAYLREAEALVAASA
jgi:hypothetical protein